MISLASHLERAGFAGGVPVAVGRCDVCGVIEEAVAGSWLNGRPVAAGDRFYVASLTKQVTGAAVALLVRDGRLDPDLPVASYLGDLPAWSATITPRQLAHHLAGLPAAGAAEPLTPGDWTDDFAHGVLRDLPQLTTPPGTAFAYSNLGYLLLARLVEELSGQPFERFVATRLFQPIGIEGIGFADDIIAQPQASFLGSSLPLTRGDGGLWSTARGFTHWLHKQNIDALGIAPLVEAPGRLNDGRPVAYGWGLGLRQHRNQPLLIHGGEWKGAVAKAVRSPTQGLAVVAMAAGPDLETLNALVDTVLNDLAR